MYRDYISENYVGACIKEILRPGLLPTDESPELAASPVGMPQLTNVYLQKITSDYKLNSKNYSLLMAINYYFYGGSVCSFIVSLYA